MAWHIYENEVRLQRQPTQRLIANLHSRVNPFAWVVGLRMLRTKDRIDGKDIHKFHVF
jgi:hypothetical protein